MSSAGAASNVPVDMAPEVDQIRRFNRAVTQRVGALSDQYLARSRPLSACRVLWEIGVEGAEVRALRARLDMDSGQLSRLLRALEADGLIEVVHSPADARIRIARLTAAGKRERGALDDRSDELARSILTPLDGAQRQQLVTAMRIGRTAHHGVAGPDADRRSRAPGRQAVPARVCGRAQPPLGHPLRSAQRVDR